jgi:imidazolonepropionase-like amidohydrolase
MATLAGAKCLGMENQIGSIEVGKFADIALIDANTFRF